MKNFKETFLYLFFGVLTTIVNITVYTFFTRAINLNFLISNAIAWIIAILFAYITNKLFVFGSENSNFKFMIKEFSKFAGCRLFSGGIEMFLMYFLIIILNMNDFIVKIISNVIVVILNYIFSKMFIFKIKEE